MQRRANQMYSEYAISTDIELWVPGADERDDRPWDVWVAFYELYFDERLRFSILEFESLIFLHHNLAPSQLMPKAWRIIMCCVMLGEEAGRQRMLEEFIVYYVPKVNS